MLQCSGWRFLPLFHVRFTARTWWDRFADKSGEDHDSKDVGQGVHELHGNDKSAEVNVLVAQGDGLGQVDPDGPVLRDSSGLLEFRGLLLRS